MAKGQVLITSSAEKATNNSAIAGFDILLSLKAYGSLNSLKSINFRTLIALFNGNPAVTVISCYCPTKVSSVIEREEFFVELSDLLQNIPKHNVLLIGGDINAQVGQNNIKGSVFNETTNENGQLLLDYLRECNLQALNIRYEHVHKYQTHF